jgi:hypothetical protein
MQLPFIQSLNRTASALAESLEQSPIVGRVISGSANSDEYICFLAGTYFYVRWSGRLLAMTAEGMRRHGRYSSLVDLLIRKSGEEAPHDLWALNDATECGADTARLRTADPGLAVEAYVAWGRALAGTGSPAYLGAAYVLEVISQRHAAQAASRLRASALIPGIERAVSFLEGHGDADIAHVATLERTLAVVDDAVDQAAIQASAQVLCLLYPAFFSTRSGSPCNDLAI